MKSLLCYITKGYILTPAEYWLIMMMVLVVVHGGGGCYFILEYVHCILYSDFLLHVIVGFYGRIFVVVVFLKKYFIKNNGDLRIMNNNNGISGCCNIKHQHYYGYYKLFD